MEKRLSMGLDWLWKRFEEYADKPAILGPMMALSYAGLRDRVSRSQQSLSDHSVRAGAVVALEADYGPDGCALLLALIDHEAIVVPISSSPPAQRDRLLSIAECQFHIHASSDEEWHFDALGGTPQHSLLRGLRAAGHPGLVLFSSGSTGESKAAVHDFTHLLAKYEIRRPAGRTIAFLLFDHIGGINTLFHLLANGGAIVPVTDRSPDAVCAAIERHRVEVLPTSPTFLNLLLISEAYRQHNLTSLKRVTYGTEPMLESTLKRLHEALPGVEFSQTYGMSELGILRAKSKASDSLLVKIGGEGYETKVVDDLLWVRARSAMLGYLNAPSPFDADGWLNTGDEVRVEGEYLRILGRRSEVINVGGEKVYPAEIESVIQLLPNVAEVMVCGEANPITGQMVVARLRVVEPEDPMVLRQRVREACRRQLAAWKVPTKVLVVSEALSSGRFKKQRKTIAGDR
jgi:acyl-CoA synthetase (AMP-forming)/AMP-acid ligase II